MFGKLREIKLKTAFLMGSIFYTMTILIHILVISSIIPYTWVNGGRSETFAIQLQLSIISVIITIIVGFFTLFVGRKMLYKNKKSINIIYWLLVVFWSIGFIQQLLGTPFERMVCSVILIIGVVSHLRIALEK